MLPNCGGQPTNEKAAIIFVFIVDNTGDNAMVSSCTILKPVQDINPAVLCALGTISCSRGVDRSVASV